MSCVGQGAAGRVHCRHDNLTVLVWAPETCPTCPRWLNCRPTSAFLVGGEQIKLSHAPAKVTRGGKHADLQTSALHPTPAGGLGNRNTMTSAVTPTLPASNWTAMACAHAHRDRESSRLPEISDIAALSHGICNSPTNQSFGSSDSPRLSQGHEINTTVDY